MSPPKSPSLKPESESNIQQEPAPGLLPSRSSPAPTILRPTPTISLLLYPRFTPRTAPRTMAQRSSGADTRTGLCWQPYNPSPVVLTSRSLAPYLYASISAVPTSPSRPTHSTTHHTHLPPDIIQRKPCQAACLVSKSHRCLIFHPLVDLTKLRLLVQTVLSDRSPRSGRTITFRFVRQLWFHLNR